jgi:hypothetical protein
MNQEPSPRPTSQAVPRGSSDGLGATVQDVTNQTKDTAGQVVDQAKDTAGQVAEQAKQQATSQLESQKERTVDTLMTVAQALHQTGQHLHEQEQTAVGGYVEQAAERVETLTNYLRTRDVPSLLAETQDLARRNPGLFLGGAVALGFIGARFLKSSGQRAITQSSTNASYSPMLGYSTPRPTQTRTPFAGGTAAPPPPAPGYASAATPEPTGSDSKLGVTGALEP